MRSIGKAAVAGGMAVLLGAALVGTALAGPAVPETATASVAAVEQDQTLAADLAFSRDEERMARDLYTLFGQTYDAPVFDRIAASEQQHFDAVGTLLARYGVADPAAGQPAGTYAAAEVQALYDQWKSQGLESQDAALAVGVALEQADIADLQDMIARTTQPDVRQVLTHLLTASQHHLAAFTGGGGACSVTGSGMGDMNGTAGDGPGPMGSGHLRVGREG
jgi:hypothetical protein